MDDILSKSSIGPLDIDPFDGNKTHVGAESLRMPRMIYGTAWKKDRTASLVQCAIEKGFRGIDTALQPEHYDEGLACEGVRLGIATSHGKLQRKSIYVQTKFSPTSMLFNVADPISKNVETSIARSLEHVGKVSPGEPAYIDCLILHTPYLDGNTFDLEKCIEAWKCICRHGKHHVKAFGVSNMTYSQFSTFYNECVARETEKKPVVFQAAVRKEPYNPDTHISAEERADRDYRKQTRQLCRELGVVFQAFWILTGNKKLLKEESVKELSRRVRIPKAVALYALFLGSDPNLAVLNGTTDPSHMLEDITGLETAAKFSKSFQNEWTRLVADFRSSLEEETLGEAFEAIDEPMTLGTPTGAGSAAFQPAS